MIAPEQQRDAFALMGRQELARRRLTDFQSLMDDSFERARHLDALAEALEAVEKREIDKLLVCMPPRHGKSRTIAQDFVGWYAGRNPRHDVIVASYGAELAEGHTRRAREILEDERYPFTGVRVSGVSHAAERWQTTQGGMIRSAGIGGSLTGFGAHALIVDDAVRDAAAADSPSVRESTWAWYSTVARTRLAPRGVQIIAGTRWHDDDLIGRILGGPGADAWHKLILPAIAGDEDPLGRSVGEPLWPARFTIEGYPSVASGEMSSRQFSALYQQAPVPESGNLFKLEWFANRYRQLPHMVATVQSIDGAWKTGAGNDASCIATWGCDGVSFYLIDVWHGRVEFPALAQQVVTQWKKHLPNAVLVEEAASGMAILQELRRTTSIPLIGVVPRGPKVSRAEAVTSYFESGKVLLPRSAPWLDAWINEHLRFPSGKHDDMVDTSSLAIPRLIDANNRVRRAERDRAQTRNWARMKMR